MTKKKIIPYMNAEQIEKENMFLQAKQYANMGADALYIFDDRVEEQENFLNVIKTVVKKVDIPIFIGVTVKRFEDVKKALYTGAEYVVIKNQDVVNDKAIEEASERFGKEKLYLDCPIYLEECNQEETFIKLQTYIAGIFVSKDDFLKKKLEQEEVNVIVTGNLSEKEMEKVLLANNVEAICSDSMNNKNILQWKNEWRKKGFAVKTLESKMKFEQFKLNQDGLIPVITQDYKTNEVLMLAYMNQEAYEKTIETGFMTYYSRSRQTLWLKGETSGNYQHVKALTIDCDNDTILAKVATEGPACHTGNHTCFFKDLAKVDYDETNPLKVLEEVYDIIRDRKENPKEGSYTNYLFEKGIDKILKKCGEEATEIVIAAKNPEAEELKYEISDFLYHMMVLMVQCGLNWDDVIQELAHRR